MFPRLNTAGSTSSAVSVAMGVILGAALTFGMQLYGNRAEEQRTARKTRGEHIERLMVASYKIKAASGIFVFRLTDVSRKARYAGPSAPNWENMLPDSGPATELQAVSALYLPEVEPEVQRVTDAFLGVCNEALESIIAKSGTDAGEVPHVDKKHLDTLREAATALQTKLIELAKQNRQ